jgi:O-antigen ligase
VGADNFSLAELRSLRAARPGVRVSGVVTHNSYLEILSENGLPGFIFWFGMIVSGLVCVRRGQRPLRASRDPADVRLVQLGDAVTLSMVAYCVGGFLLSHGYYPYILVFVAMAGGIRTASEKAVRRGRVPRVALAATPRPAVGHIHGALRSSSVLRS